MDAIGGSHTIRVTFYGVRGSTPCNSDDVSKYGGNTSCVGVAIPGERPLCFDLGTGLRYFGHRQAKDSPFRGTCLLTHLHWDHTQGLPFFTPLLTEGAEFDVYAPVQDDGRTVAEVMAATIRPPLFPIPLAAFPGVTRFHDKGDEEFDIGGIHVVSRLIPHVGPTLGFRIEHEGRSIAYLSDHQQPYDGSNAVSEGALELVRDVDLLIHDSQYTHAEFVKKSTWGHCTADYAMWLAAHAGVKRLALFHHDPTRSDGALDEQQQCAATLGRHAGIEMVTAAEGLTIELS